MGNDPCRRPREEEDDDDSIRSEDDEVAQRVKSAAGDDVGREVEKRRDDDDEWYRPGGGFDASLEARVKIILGDDVYDEMMVDMEKILEGIGPPKPRMHGHSDDLDTRPQRRRRRVRQDVLTSLGISTTKKAKTIMTETNLAMTETNLAIHSYTRATGGIFPEGSRSYPRQVLWTRRDALDRVFVRVAQALDFLHNDATEVRTTCLRRLGHRKIDVETLETILDTAVGMVFRDDDGRGDHIDDGHRDKIEKLFSAALDQPWVADLVAATVVRHAKVLLDDALDDFLAVDVMPGLAHSEDSMGVDADGRSHFIDCSFLGQRISIKFETQVAPQLLAVCDVVSRLDQKLPSIIKPLTKMRTACDYVATFRRTALVPLPVAPSPNLLS